MAKQTHATFETTLRVGEDDGNPWNMVVSREDDTLVFGMHWKEKSYPTHTFTIKVDDLVKLMEANRG